ncbi:MAG: trypsin-like peptidase domain-containing protein [Oscillatoria princeps RMCB-10]|jgi:S1-C subfamily serine protease|nr:trypsin-like peptidase domain-containing protein [Oscillatoria princeps RMCB-10]
MSSFFKQFALYLSLLAIGGGAGFLGSRYADGENRALRPQTVPVAIRSVAPVGSPAPQMGLSAGSNPNFIAEAAEKVGPSVVRIDSARTVASKIPQAFDNPLFRKFFGEEQPQQEEQVERGTGSGFILSSDGQLLTNAHVVDGADVVQVTLKDGRTFDGKVLGADPLTDVAVVKIDAEDLPAVQLGNSENLVAGQWAIAIGNPLGLDNTVTVGIISATGRSSSEVGIPDKRVRFLQTDAAINPGNSGGPLLNDRGEVIGVNTAIRANAQGLGFAIPIETAKRIADELFASGRAEHPYLGIKMVELSPELREEINQQAKGNFKITQDKGVLILGVQEGSPAQKAGVRAGDIIQSIDSIEIQKTDEVQERVEASAVGAVLELEVNRNGVARRLEARLGAFPVEGEK